MAGTISNIGYILRSVVSPPEDAVSSHTTEVELPAGREDFTMGTRRGKAKPAGRAGLEPLASPDLAISPAFRLVVILVFILILVFGAATVLLAIYGDPSKSAIQSAYTAMSTLLTASAGAILGLIGGKAV
jgi:hypothetical protein